MGKNKTILITGGAGFIGSNALEYFFKKYPLYNFIVLDLLTYAGDIKNIPEKIQKDSRFKFWYGDVRNAKLVERLVSQANIVIHFAAETHIPRSIFDDTIFFETDVIGTQRVANAVLHNKEKIEKFIHISTSEVYGTAVSEKMDENHPLNPQSPYAAAKTGADRLVYSYITTYKIPATIIRPFNIFGPKQHLEKLIPRFITNCIMNEPLTIHGTGESKRDFTYVDDLIRAIDLIIHAPKNKVDGQIFNVGSGKSRSINEIADLISKTFKHKKNFKHNAFALNIGDRPGQIFRHTADADKIKNVLGWEPKIDFAIGLTGLLDWYFKNKDWWINKLWMRHVPIETEKGKIEFH